MKRFYQKYSLLLPLLAVVVLVTPQIAFAEWTPIQDTLYFLVVNLFGMLVRIGGALLDFAINNFVLGFGATFANSGIGIAVNNGWAVIRDFINLFFIFGLVYIGFKMILDSDNSNTRRWLANLIIAALLINFSLFATKFVIDFSNQLSAEIAVAGLGAVPTGDGKYESSVSGAMMGQLGLASAFQTTSKPAGAGYGYIFGLAILFMITAFVLGAGGILLIIRFAVLNLYLVFSAVMFIGWVFPIVGDQMSKYWSGFIKRCFFAPIFLLFLYFAFQMVGELQKTVDGLSNTGQSLGTALGAGSNADDSVTIQNATLGTIPFFFLVCTFMIIALLAAQKIGADGANMAVKTGKSWGNKVQRGVRRGAGAATVGVGASLGRNTAGRYANHLASSDKWKDDASKSLYGRAKLGAAKYAAGASFDARQVGGVGKNLGIGEGTTGGYKKKLEEDAKKAKKYAEGLGTVDIDSDEGKVRVAKLKAETEAKATADRARAGAAKNDFESDKLQSEATLSGSISTLSGEITAKEAALSSAISGGTMTTKERADAERHIADEKSRLAEKKKNMEYVKIKDAALLERRKHARAEASATTPEEKAKAREAYDNAQAAWTKAGQDRDSELAAQEKEAQDTFTNAESDAKAAIKYERQIAYIQQQQRSAERWSNRASSGGAGASGAVVGGVLGIVGGGVFGAAAAAAASAKGASHANIVKELEEEYGKKGTKKMKKENQKKRAKETAEALAEMTGEGDKEDKKEDKK